MAIKYRHTVALLLSIAIHLIFFSPLLFLKRVEPQTQPPRKVLNLSQFETQKREPIPQAQPQKTLKKQPQKQIQKPLPQPIKQALKPELPKKELNTTRTARQTIEPITPVAQESKKSPALSALNDAFKSSPKTESSGLVKKLYGDEFDSMSEAQKEFIRDNLSGIGRITEKHLRYPDVAGKLGMQGQSVVEFWLHPNGDISELRLLDTSGYKALDKNSIETIEIAYKDYPRPRQKTKIRIYVRYSIY